MTLYSWTLAQQTRIIYRASVLQPGPVLMIQRYTDTDHSFKKDTGMGEKVVTTT